MHPPLPLVLLLPLFLLAAAAPTPITDPVDTALVLVSDVSRSIDDSEFALEKQGYAAALADPRILSAIRNGPNGAIAIAYVEFAGAYEVATIVPWRIVRDDASARTLADAIAAAPRSARGRTAIGAGMQRALDLLDPTIIQAPRRVIDVAGDGTNNSGPDPADIRADALARGINVNGLAIINDHPVSWTFAHVQPPGGLAAWYRANVVGGPGSFVVEVHDFTAFKDAMTRKLIDEIAFIPPAIQPAAKRIPS